VVVTFTEQALNVLSRRSPLPALHVRTQTPVSGELFFIQARVLRVLQESSLC
jgi:hypothetical protein